jgi:shikimate dehydrogenase
MQPPAPTAATRLYALLGDPVAHSLSPIFQNAAMRHLGCDAVYIALRCDAAHAPGLLRAIGRAGGGGNVTIPHKLIAADCIERPTEQLRRTGACNTFWLEDGQLCGDNTDVIGFRTALRRLVPDISGATTLVVGAGGAAAAVVCALIDDGVGRITLHNRSPDRAHTLAARFDPSRTSIDVVLSATSLAKERYDLVVNASSVGLGHNDPLPLDLELLDSPGAALDLVCHPPRATPWVRQARRLGIAAADGVDMLIAQGAAAFERWFNLPAPVDVMRAALIDR